MALRRNVLGILGEIHGQTIIAMSGAWEELDQLLETTIRHASGAALPIAAVATDLSDGQTSGAVYDYVRKRHRAGRPVFAIKGASDSEGKIEIWRASQAKSIDPHANGSKAAKHGVHVHIVGTAKAKDAVLGWAQEGGRVRLTGEGPHRMHWYETVRPDFYEQLPGLLMEAIRAEIGTEHVPKGSVSARRARDNLIRTHFNGNNSGEHAKQFCISQGLRVFLAVSLQM